MSIGIQGDFSNYFDLVESKAISSTFYTDIKKYFKEGKIDAKTYVGAITSLHQDTLKEAVFVAREMSIGIRELELKINDSEAEVAFKNAQTSAIATELSIKQADSSSRMPLDGARTSAIATELSIKQADSSSRIALDSARTSAIATELSINQTSR